MSGNLIDEQVKNYQQNVAFQSQLFQKPTLQPRVGNQTVDTTPGTDTYQSQQPASDKKKTLIVLGSWLGLNTLTDLFNSNCSKADYNKTLMGRLGNLGDKIVQKSSSNKVFTAAKASFNVAKNRISKFINNSPILSAMTHTPTKPENAFVTGFMETQHAADLKEAATTITGYLDEMPKSLKEAGATKAEIQALKAKYGKTIFGGIKNQAKALQELQFNRIGAPANFIDTLAPEKIAETLKEMKIKHLGLKPETYEAILKAPEKYSKQITEACKRGGKFAKAIHGRFSWIPGLSLITKRSTNLGMSYNKLSTAAKHSSKLGQNLAKLPKIIMRGLTFGGGKLNSLLVAFGLGTALYNATKAPKNQKVGTAVAGGVEAVSWIVSMPLAIKLMHSFSGMQYAGLSKMQVGRYRVALRNFNKAVDAGKYTTKAAYDTALAAVNKMKALPTGTSKVTKGLAKLGSFLGIALENPTPFKQATTGLKGSAKLGAIFKNIGRKMPLLGKNLIGYPLRFAIYAALFSPLVDKVISSCTSAIFGKPYEPEEAENKEGEKGAEEVASNPAQTQEEQPVEQAQKTNPTSEESEVATVVPHKPVDIESLPDENLIKRGVHGEEVVAKGEERTYIPSEKCEVEGYVSPYDKEDRSYIPSEEAPTFIQNNSDAALVDSALSKARKREEEAMNFIRGM